MRWRRDIPLPGFFRDSRPPDAVRVAIWPRLQPAQQQRTLPPEPRGRERLP